MKLELARVAPALLVAGTLMLATLPARAGGPVSARTRVLRSWDDTIKVDGADKARHVEIVFDYRTGVATETITDTAGAVLSTRELVDNPPQPTREEFQEAIDIALAEEVIGIIVKHTNAVFEGGFLLERKDPGAVCGPRTRCVELQILDQARFGVIRKVVVDLVSRSIAIPIYWPVTDSPAYMEAR